MPINPAVIEGSPMRRTSVRWTWVLVGLAGALAAGGGCGIGRTAAEKDFIVSRVIDADARMLADDLSLFFQTDRAWRGSRFPMP